MNGTQQAPQAAQQPGQTAVERLSQLVAMLAEDALFCLAGAGNSRTAFEGLAKRRAPAHSAVMQGIRAPSMTEEFDAWLVELTRAMAPVAPPVWLPMGEVVREKVTLEIGAHGLRSLFSSKPSEKDVQRVSRLGSLAVRVLRTVFAADGNVDAEEARSIAVLIGSLGLPQAEAAPLYTEPVMSIEKMEIYGEIEPSVKRALLRGAWLAASWDSIDPREEQVVRTLARKLAVEPSELEEARSDVLARVDARRVVGLATLDAVRYVLSESSPTRAAPLASRAGILMLPRRYREEALGQIGRNAPVSLARRYAALSREDKTVALAVAWCAALHDDPAISHQALLRARHERVAEDLEERGDHARELVANWIDETLAATATQIGV